MTENEIIKALRCCHDLSECGECEYGKFRTKEGLCIDMLHSDTADLINCQKAEIEELRKATVKNLDNFATEYDKNIKSEAIKEFAERLKNKIINTSTKFSAEKGTYDFLTGSAHRQLEILEYVDNLEEEMTVGKENEQKQVLEQIYELVKEFYGDCVSVDIFVNSEGIECNTTEKPFTIENSMRTISGKWLNKLERMN